MADFNGTIQVKHNPVTAWETYAHTFEKSPDEKTDGYFGLKFSNRAEGGYYRADFSIRGPYGFLSEFVQNALGREIIIRGNDGDVVWEGYIHALEYDAGSAVYSVDLSSMSNAVFVRYRVRGTSTTVRSKVQTDANSIAKFGRKEFVLSGGELESTDIADNIALQYLNLHKWPVPTPSRIDPEQELAEYPTVNIKGRGWYDTLDWCTYNQTADTSSQGANAQVYDIVIDTDVGQFIQYIELGANATSISKEYDADRRGGAIVKDISRVGDSLGNRWIVYMDKDRTFRYERAMPPTETT